MVCVSIIVVSLVVDAVDLHELLVSAVTCCISK